MKRKFPIFINSVLKIIPLILDKIILLIRVFNAKVFSRENFDRLAAFNRSIKKVSASFLEALSPYLRKQKRGYRKLTRKLSRFIKELRQKVPPSNIKVFHIPETIQEKLPKSLLINFQSRKHYNIKRLKVFILIILSIVSIQSQLYRINPYSEKDTSPDFEIINQQSSGELEFKFDYTKSVHQSYKNLIFKPWLSYKAPEAIISVYDYNGKQYTPEVSITKQTEEIYKVTVVPTQLPPGEYTAKLKVYKDGTYYEQQQRFAYGVLAINTNKASYKVGEVALLQMGVLRNDGHTVCDADLELKVTDPDGKETILPIEESGKCVRNNVIDVPDYAAHYPIEKEGIHKLHLLNKANQYEIDETFVVVSDTSFEVERTGPTRIYPFVPYTFEFKIKANIDFKGQVKEKVPKGFDITNHGTTEVEDAREIVWEVDLNKGEEIELSYEFDAPDESPELYHVGPLTIGNFQEARLWQIAGDADEQVVFTTPGTNSWTVPAGVTSLTVETWGGGGGGKGGTYGLPGGGAGGGAYSKKIVAVTPGVSYNAVVGSGGAAGAANGGNGGNGGNSSFSANTGATTASGGTGATGSIGASGGTTNGSADLSYSGGNGGSGYQGITYIGAASAAATSVTLPTHQKGDLILIMAFKDDSITLPTVPAAGWMVLGTAAEANATSAILAYKVASNSSEVSGTWVGATEVVVDVYRGHAGIGVWLGNTGNSNQINYPALSLSVTDGSSWVAALAGHRTATNVEQAPSGMVNRTFAGSESAGHDTNGGLSSWSSADVSVNASSRWYSWVVEIKAAKSSTALTYVSSATGVTSVTMPTHQAGDLLVGFAYRDGNNSAPSIPTAENWRVWGSGSGANTNSSIVGYKVAASSSEASGTWTNATGVSVHVYRNHAGYGANADTGAASTTVTYPALTLQVTDGSSWVAGFAGHRSVDTDLQNPPSGMVSRSTFVNATNEIAGHDTNGGVSSWSDTNVAVGGTSLGWRARTLEIKSLIQPLGGGGGGSSAGTAANGNNGNSSSGSSGGSGATAPTNGGNGGAGGNSSAAGTNGSLPGGGGGGGGNLSVSGNAGGAGANGKVIITYSPPTGINISGTCKQENQSTNCTDTGTLRVAVNGSLQAQTQATVAGTWTISGVVMPSANDVITVFVDGAAEADEAVAVTTYDGSGDITGMDLIAQRLSIGNSDNRTITNPNLSQYDNGASGDEDIFHEVDGANDLAMIETNKPNAELYIKTGNIFRPASDNTGNITVNDLEIAGTLTADGNTLTVTGDSTPLVVSGTLNEDTSTFRYTSTSTTTITPETYYHLILAPSAAGSPTYTLGNTTFNISRNLTIGNGTNTVSINWTTNDPAINIGGNLTLSNNSTWTKSDSATLTFNGVTTPVTLTDSNSSKQDLGKIIIDGSKEVDMQSSVKAQTVDVTAGDTLDMQSSGYTLTITGSGTSSSRPFIVVGNLTEGNGTVEYTGTSATAIDDEDYANLTVNQAGTTFTANGNVTASGIFRIQAGTFDAGSNTITLTGAGDPFDVDGSFTESTSTVHYASTSATNITADTYYNLNISNIAQSSSFDFTTATGSINVLGDLTVGHTSGAGTATLQVNTNDTTVDVNDDLTINSKGAISASSNAGSPLYVGSDFTNNGVFTHNNGKVVLDSPVHTSQSVSGSNTFYNLQIETGDRQIILPQGITTSIAANGSFSLTGNNCENMIRVRSSGSGVQTVLSVNSSASASVSHVDLQDINLTGKTITAGNSVNSGNNSGNWTVNANACLGTSSNENSTGSSFQRKVIYDDQNSRYWSFNHDGDEIEIKYSADDGTSWSNPVTAASGRLPYDTNDFSVWWNSVSSTEYVVVAVADGGNIKVRQGVLSSNDISWDSDISTALDETGSYMYPYIILDSANHLWVGATYQSGSDYSYKTTVTAETVNTDPATWTWEGPPRQIGSVQASANVYGTITALSNEDMYASFVIGTDLLGCKWDDSEDLWKNSADGNCETITQENSEASYFDSLTDGLVAYWKMNESSWNGTTGEVIDSSGSGYNATAQNGPTTINEGFGRSGTFAGDNDFVNAGNVTQLNNTSEFSVSQWVYITDVTAQDRIFHKITNGNNDISIAPFYQTTQRIYFEVGNGANSYGYWESTGVVANNNWYNIVGVYDGSAATNAEKLKLYVNGVQRTMTYVGTIPSTTASLSGTNLILGAGSSAEYFTGKLDDVRVYSRDLSSEEVGKLYQLVPEQVNIDNASDFGSLPGASKQIVRTNSGTLYSFVNDGGNCEMWKSTNGIAWTNTASQTCDSSSNTAIAIDAQNDIHVLYTDSVASNLIEWVKYSTSTDLFGTPETVLATAANLSVITFSISTDSGSIPHVAWIAHNSSSDTISGSYRNRTGGSWSSVTVFGTSSGSGISMKIVDITIDLNNIPEIVYLQTGFGLSARLGNANNATTFDYKVLDSTVNNTDNQRGTSISVNTLTGDTWIAYVDSNNDIALAKHVFADNWTTWSTITTKTDIGYEPSIAITGTGEIYVFYQNDENDIAYDIFDPVAGTWSGEEVLHTGTFQDIKTKWSFEWNNFGTNKIDYLFSDGTDVYYDYLFLRRTPTNIDDTSDFGVMGGAGRQIVRTSSGVLYSFMNDGGNCEMWKSTNEGVTWINADSEACNSASPTAMALSSSNNIQVAFASESNLVGWAEYSTVSDTFGSIEQVDTAGSGKVLASLDLQVDSNGVGHITWTYSILEDNDSLKYRNRVGGSWNTALSIDSGMFVISPVKLTINEDNLPEVIAFFATSSLRTYVGNQNNATSFTNKTLDFDINTSDGQMGGSIAVNPITGDSWIVYISDLDNYVSLVKHNDGDNWTTWQTPVTNSKVGSEPSIVIDENGHVLVFYKNNQDDIVFDKYNGSSWSGETVLEMHGVLQDVKPVASIGTSNIIDYLYSDGTDIWYNRYLNPITITGSQDSIASGLSTGLNKNISSVGQTISTVDYVHLAYVNSSGNIYYDRYDGDWDFTAGQLNSNTDNTYLGLSLNSLTKDLYLGSIRSSNDDIYTTKATYSAGPTWSWGAPTILKSDPTKIYTNYSANYSGKGQIGSLFLIGEAPPFMIGWQGVLAAPNNLPTVGTISVNGNEDIALMPNSTFDVEWTATIRDLDGFAGIASVKGKLYRSGVSGAQSCTNNNNNCYEDLSCDLSGCSGNTCTATCSASVYYHADPTDGDSSQPSEYWRGWMEATDSASDTGVGFSPAGSPDINTLLTISADPLIDYGIVITGDNSNQKTLVVNNVGNSIMDVELSGTTMCTDFPTCLTQTIPVNGQEYSLGNFSYGSGTDLTTSPVISNINLEKPTTSEFPLTDNIYWRLGIPAQQGTGQYSGRITIFGALNQ